MKQNRNDPCACGSGLKFKKCCGKISEGAQPASQPLSIQGAIQQIAGLFSAGRLLESEALCAQVLAAAPEHPDALYLAGLTARSAGKTTKAVNYLSRAVTASPGNPSFHCGLGIALYDDGQTQAAISALERAITLQPDYADAHNNIGYIHMQEKRDAAAEQHLRRAIALDPNPDAAYCNLGIVLDRCGKFEDAVFCFRKALSLNRDYADAYNNLGSLLHKSGNSKEAAACFRQALRVNPMLINALLNLAAILNDEGKPNEAIQCCQRAIQIQPQCAEAYASLAAAQKASEQLDAAIQSCETALRLNPALIDGYRILGTTLRQQDRNAEAVVCFNKALSVAPSHFEYRIQAMFTALPRFVNSRDEIARIRTGLLESIEQLTEIEGRVISPETAAFALFSLAYYGENDRLIAERAGALVRAKFPLLLQASVRTSSSADGRIRIGFISGLLRNHTIGKLTIGHIRHMDRSRFHITVIHGPNRIVDDVSESIDHLADSVICLTPLLSIACQQIADLSLDVLHFTDVGMVPFINVLAHMRFAPVQTVTWGHPVTTGLDSIDYFLSFDAAEPEGAEDHYTETLIRLKRAPAYYEPFDSPPTVLPRTALGLPPEGRLYGCMQSLFKFHPDFDATLAGIIARDPDAWIVVIAAPESRLRAQLSQRWADHYPELPNRVVFVPPVNGDGFMALIANMDVMLDTAHFGSGNTFYESMVYGIPTITWPGHFMRGRLVAAFYRWLGIADAPIANSLEDYARIAVDLATNPQRLGALKQQLLAIGPAIYRDEQSVRELEDFFSAAVAAHQRHEKLHNWSSTYAWPSQQGAEA